MRKIHVANPNSSAQMTRAIERLARRVASHETEVVVTAGTEAPASIEGYTDQAASVPGLLKRIREFERVGVGAHVIACFDDPGLDAAREVASVPVVGMCEAAMIAACRLSKRFSVVTSLARSVAIVEDLAESYGCGRRLIRVHHADLPVLELHLPEARDKLVATLARVAKVDSAEAVVLGCSGMSADASALSKAAGVEVIDGLSFSVKLAEAFASLDMRTSKTNTYAAPRSKPGALFPADTINADYAAKLSH